MHTKEEIKKAREKAKKDFTERQLCFRKFCNHCLKYKIKKSFTYNSNSVDGRNSVCRSCRKVKYKKDTLQKNLLAKEIYTEGASQIVVDKVVGGRGLITKASLAKFLGVSERTILRLKNKGDITGYNFLGYLYFKKEEIEDYLEEKLGERIELDNKYIS